MTFRIHAWEICIIASNVRLSMRMSTILCTYFDPESFFSNYQSGGDGVNINQLIRSQVNQSHKSAKR